MEHVNIVAVQIILGLRGQAHTYVRKQQMKVKGHVNVNVVDEVSFVPISDWRSEKVIQAELR